MAPPPPLMATPQMAFMEWNAPYEPSSPPHHHEGSPPTRHHSPSVVAAAASSQRMRTARSAAEPRGGTRRLVQTRTVEGVRSSIDARHGFLRPRAQAASGLEAIVARMTAGMLTRMGMETPPRGALGGARVPGNTRRCSSHGSSRNAWMV